MASVVDAARVNLAVVFSVGVANVVVVQVTDLGEEPAENVSAIRAVDDLS